MIASTDASASVEKRRIKSPRTTSPPRPLAATARGPSATRLARPPVHAAAATKCTQSAAIAR